MDSQGRTDSADDVDVVHTGSISSTVDLDFVHNEAHKIYHPSPPVRLLYFLAFQAPFPYVANHEALEAARQRRIVVDLLTYYWFNHHLVARVLDIEDTPEGGHDFVTRLVRGHEPKNDKRTRAFLKDLDEKFLAAGLPTWQVTRYNPHSITNFIERSDGTYRIIDLESSLVAVLYPVSGILELMRAGLFPSFDDIHVAKLRRYVAINETSIKEKLGREYPRLQAAIDRYEESAEAWHRGERRWLNKGLRWLSRRAGSYTDPTA